MFNIIFLVAAFGISIFVASLTIRRQKGEDWYSPISNNEKMVESIINISIILIILTTIFKYMILDLKLFLLLLVIIISITSVFAVFSKINKKHNKGATNDNEKTLRDLLTRFVTVYNVLYLVFSIIHLSIMAKKDIENFDFFASLEDTLEIIFESNSTLVVSFTILTWTSIIGTIISLLGWTFSNNVDKIEIKEKVNYNFFVNRVMGRNKKWK